ncbi:MAG TPA: vanadium-dependent haloperoxidase [Pyrinomonadaceae bacterium]
MKNKYTVAFFLTFAVILCAQLAAWAQVDETAKQSLGGEDVVLRWNRLLKETVSTPGQHPATILPVRSYAMMHAAMFDAVNSIDGGYTAYLTDVPGSKSASLEAAAAQAAHDVLLSLYPTRASVFAAELAASLEGIDVYRAQQGIRVGQLVAAAMVAARANDGWGVTPPAYSLPSTPGNWQPTPPANSAATFTHYPAVTPFAVTSGTQFVPSAPPAITSAEYAAALNEVKEIGSATSTTRTADQTLAARLWANVNTPTNFLFVWNNVAHTVSEARGIGTVEKARLFALTNIALHDALQTAFASKFQYGLWRPVTAIRRADEDGNPSTEADPAWTSLIGTPPYPSYAGNMAAIGTSQSTVLAMFFGRDDISFSHTWDGAGGATRSYVGFTAMANEQERARVWGGIHFTFDNVAGQSIGRSVGTYVFQNIMQPRRCVQ